MFKKHNINMQTNRKVFIGIDPDVDNIGVAVLDAKKEVVLYNMKTVYGFIEWLKGYYRGSNGDRKAIFEIRIEMNQRDKIPVSSFQQTYMKTKSKVKGKAGELAGIKNCVNRALSVGRNHEVANQIFKTLNIFFDVCDNFKIIRIDPTQRQRLDGNFKNADSEEIRESVLLSIKRNRFAYPSKIDKKRFNQLFGFPEKMVSNCEKRDAAMLIYPQYLITKNEV